MCVCVLMPSFYSNKNRTKIYSRTMLKSGMRGYEGTSNLSHFTNFLNS